MYTPYKNNLASTNVYRSHPVFVDFAPYYDYVGPGPGSEQASQTVDNYGGSLNVTASIDASLYFSFEGLAAVDGAFYTEGDNATIVDSADTGCFFGTLTPNVAKVCTFKITLRTNAPNGFSVYTVQDQNMTFNGNTIKQFNSGTRVDDLAAVEWAAPSANAGAHLGYSSNDEGIFPPTVNNDAVWAGIPNKVAAGVAASSPAGLVASTTGPEDSDAGRFALKIEAGTGQPQAIAALGQQYSNNVYFIVVGNF